MLMTREQMLAVLLASKSIMSQSIKPQFAFAVYSDKTLLPYTCRYQKRDCVKEFGGMYGTIRKVAIVPVVKGIKRTEAK